MLGKWYLDDHPSSNRRDSFIFIELILYCIINWVLDCVRLWSRKYPASSTVPSLVTLWRTLSSHRMGSVSNGQPLASGSERATRPTLSPSSSWTPPNWSVIIPSGRWLVGFPSFRNVCTGSSKSVTSSKPRSSNYRTKTGSWWPRAEKAAATVTPIAEVSQNKT